MSPTKNASKALAELSPNTTSPTKTSTEDSIKKTSLFTADDMPATAAFPITNSYISPSDAVMSPTSKKLSEIKGRRLAGGKSKQLNGRELFAKVRAQNDKNNGASSSFSDTQTDSQESAAQSIDDRS